MKQDLCKESVDKIGQRSIFQYPLLDNDKNIWYQHDFKFPMKINNYRLQQALLFHYFVMWPLNWISSLFNPELLNNLEQALFIYILEALRWERYVVLSYKHTDSLYHY